MNNSIDFGRAGDVLKAISLAYARRDVDPVVPLGFYPPDNYTGSFTESAIALQQQLGSNHDFLWAVHRWDDRENTVA